MSERETIIKELSESKKERLSIKEEKDSIFFNIPMEYNHSLERCLELVNENKRGRDKLSKVDILCWAISEVKSRAKHLPPHNSLTQL